MPPEPSSPPQNNGSLRALPVLFRSSDLGAPTNIPLQRSYPMSVPSSGSNVRAFDPNIKLPYAATYTFGWQRALARTTSVEARFIHTDSYGRWTLGDISQRNCNELNIVENKFIDEFAGSILCVAISSINSDALRQSPGKRIATRTAAPRTRPSGAPRYDRDDESKTRPASASS